MTTPFPVCSLTYNCCEDEHSDQITDDGKHVPEIDQGNTSWITIKVCSTSLAPVHLYERKKEKQIGKAKKWKNIRIYT